MPRGSDDCSFGNKPCIYVFGRIMCKSVVKNSIKRDKNGEVGSDKVTKAKKVEKKY